MSYKGLCLDGPLAGHWVSYRAVRFGVSNGFMMIYRDPFGPNTCETIVFRYEHCRVDDLCKFRVPEGKNEHWAMQFLIRNYRADHKVQEVCGFLIPSTKN